jgi:hypothetical protein
MSWIFDQLRHLASEERVFIVVDGIHIDQASPDGDDWRPLLKGLARLVDTTVVTIAPASGHLVDVTIRRETSEFHSFATSPEAQELLHRLHAELDPATVYVGGGTHASALERGLTGRDVNLTTKWRPCGHGQALAAAELDKAKPLLEMLYLLRRDGDSCQAPDPVAGGRFRA